MLRRNTYLSGTESDWSSRNPILPKGELAFVAETGQYKFGDGHTHWVDLPLLGGAAPDLTPSSSVSSVHITGTDLTISGEYAQGYMQLYAFTAEDWLIMVDGETHCTLAEGTYLAVAQACVKPNEPTTANAQVWLEVGFGRLMGKARPAPDGEFAATIPYPFSTTTPIQVKIGTSCFGGTGFHAIYGDLQILKFA